MEPKVKKALDTLKKDKYIQTMFPEEIETLEAAAKNSGVSLNAVKAGELLTKIATMSIEAKTLMGVGGEQASPSSKRPRKSGTEQPAQ